MSSFILTSVTTEAIDASSGWHNERVPGITNIEVQRWQDSHGLFDTSTTRLTLHSLPNNIIAKYREFEAAIIDHIQQTIE